MYFKNFISGKRTTQNESLFHDLKITNEHEKVMS